MVQNGTGTPHAVKVQKGGYLLKRGKGRVIADLDKAEADMQHNPPAPAKERKKGPKHPKHPKGAKS